MNAIYQYLNNLDFMTDITSKIISIGVITLMIFILYKDGLAKSIFIDNPLWSLCYILLIVLLICSFALNVEKFNIVRLTNNSEITWALNSCVILFSGPIMCIQNWQMAEKLKREKNIYLQLPNYLSLNESKKLLQVYANSEKINEIISSLLYNMNYKNMNLWEEFKMLIICVPLSKARKE